MNYEEIRSRYCEMQRIMYGTLRYVMQNLPTNCGIKCNALSFKDSAFPPIVYLEDQLTEAINRVTVTLVEISPDGEELRYEGYYTDFDDYVEVDGGEVIDKFDTQTCKAILDAIDQDVMDRINPFYPQPQTLMVTSTEDVEMYLEIEERESDDEVRDFITTFEDHCITRCSFITDYERKAYMKGSDDTVGYLEACFIPNDKHQHDI